ncbi:MAG: hypothetical protein D6806_14865 [Deltaproteobacteria bacterium]|nr:MAG: hypothetical protein D6806_14865 [Deltaproteobacteria bacterium]
MRISLALVFLPLAVASAGDFFGSDAYRGLRRSGISVVAEHSWDIDGDGKLEIVLAERHKEGLAVSVWRTAETGFILAGRTRRTPADELVRLEQVLLGSHVAIWFETALQNPDEDDHRTRLLVVQAGRILKILDEQYRVVHPESEAGRTARRILRLGPDTPGWQIGTTTDGWPDLLLRDEPKLLHLSGRHKKALWLSVGMRKRLYRFSENAYRLVSSGFSGFLQPVRVRRIECGKESLCAEAAEDTALRLLSIEVSEENEGTTCADGFELRVDKSSYRIGNDLSIKGPDDLIATGSFADTKRPGKIQVLAVFNPARKWRRLELTPLTGVNSSSQCFRSARLFADGHHAVMEER